MPILLILVFLSLQSWGLPSLAMVSAPTPAAQCPAGETEVSRLARSESAACVTSGYCMGWGINPQNGEYEYFYGFHDTCDGVQTRDVIELSCTQPGGAAHTLRFDGPFGVCTVL